MMMVKHLPEGKTLTVKGNYVGNNGQLNIRTVLGDDKSATDRLIVEGNTSGSTTVYVKMLEEAARPR